VPEDKSKTVLESGQRTLAQLANRVRGGLAGKGRQVMAVAALTGVTSIGLAAASFAHPDPSPTTATTWASQDARDAAAQRADRSQRDAAASTSASATADAAKNAAQAAKAADAKKAAAAKAAPMWVVPMAGAQITSCYGQRWGVLHAGIDFASVENTPERAVGAGTVIAAGWNYSGYGISVVVDHGNGYLTHYAHMNKTAVRVGQKVKPGTVLGY
jgi:murein DD-endopeptidase MepM/ murein hydrolase activator NlpD